MKTYNPANRLIKLSKIHLFNRSDQVYYSFRITETLVLFQEVKMHALTYVYLETSAGNFKDASFKLHLSFQSFTMSNIICNSSRCMVLQ